MRDEKVEEEIFVDMLSTEGYTIDQVLDFFNLQTRFFPIKARDHGKPILLAKQSVVKIEIPGALERFLEDSSTHFAGKKEASSTWTRWDPFA